MRAPFRSTIPSATTEPTEPDPSDSVFVEMEAGMARTSNKAQRAVDELRANHAADLEALEERAKKGLHTGRGDPPHKYVPS